MNVYIACGLTHVPRRSFRSYAKRIHQLANHLDRVASVKYALLHSDPQLSLLDEDKKPQACYLWDKKMVESADIIIAEASYPSTGLGIELQIAQQSNIPIILCYRENKSNRAKTIEYVNPDKKVHTLQIGTGYISLMALGMPCVAEVVSYSSGKDLNFRIMSIISNKFL